MLCTGLCWVGVLRVSGVSGEQAVEKGTVNAEEGECGRCG